MTDKPSSSQNESNDFIFEQPEKIKADSRKRIKDVSLIIHNHDLRPLLEKHLTGDGVFLASLSNLRLPVISYLLGYCSRQELDKYLIYERNLLLTKMKQSYLGYQTFDEKTGHELAVHGIRFQPHIVVEMPTEEDIIQYAQKNGYVLQIPEASLTLAKELQKTSFLFEVLKSNINNVQLNSEDGLIPSNWYDHSSYEATEYTILKNLILLHHELPVKDDEFVALLNLLIYSRLKTHAETLFSQSGEYAHNSEEALKMIYASQLLDNFVPKNIDFPKEERVLLLNLAIQKAKKAIESYPDKQHAKYMLDWLSNSVKDFEKEIPDELSKIQISISTGVLNSLYMKQMDNVEIKKPQKKKKQSNIYSNNSMKNDIEVPVVDKDFLSLSRDEQLVRLCKNYNKTVFKSLVAFVKKIPPETMDEWKEGIANNEDGFYLENTYKQLYVLSKLPDVYTYFALGIITRQQADDIAVKGKEIFNERASLILDSIFDEFMRKHDGVVSEEIEQYYKLYQKARKTGSYQSLNLTKAMIDLNVPSKDIDACTPSVKEVLTALLTEDFDKHINLALRFKPEYFKHIENFKEISDLLVDNRISAMYLHLDDVLPENQYNVDGDSDKKMISKLKLINDIFMAVQEDLPMSTNMIKARILLKEMMCGYYQKTLQSLDELPTNKHSTEITPQLRYMARSFKTLMPHANVFDKEKENMAFLACVARSVLKDYTASEATRAYYISWFDKEYGSTEAEDSRYLKRKIKSLNLGYAPDDDIVLSEAEEYKKQLLDFYYTDEDQKITGFDNRGVFGVCNDVELLYAMGIFTPFEHALALKAMGEIYEADPSDDKDVRIGDVYTHLQNKELPLKLPLTSNIVKTMEQIRIAGQLMDNSHLYKDVRNLALDYNKEAPTITIHDLKKDPLKAEGLLIDMLIMIMNDFPEMNLTASKALKSILNSYWTESVLKLKSLQNELKDTHPEISNRIAEQQHLFGVKDGQKVETISNRFRYYPKLFQQIRKTMLDVYQNYYKTRTAKLAFFEKEIAPFVSFYKKRAPALDVYWQQKNDRTH